MNQSKSGSGSRRNQKVPDEEPTPAVAIPAGLSVDEAAKLILVSPSPVLAEIQARHLYLIRAKGPSDRVAGEREILHTFFDSDLNGRSLRAFIGRLPNEKLERYIDDRKALIYHWYVTDKEFPDFQWIGFSNVGPDTTVPFAEDRLLGPKRPMHLIDRDAITRHCKADGGWRDICVRRQPVSQFRVFVTPLKQGGKKVTWQGSEYVDPSTETPLLPTS